MPNPPRSAPPSLVAVAGAALCASVVGAGPALSQDMEDPARLAGVTRVSVRATAEWDDLITMSAGGATEDQFIEALGMGFEAALSSAEAGPEVDPDAPNFVSCHVDTFYESGLIVYSVRVSHHQPDAEGRLVITWLESWVGSYTAQQLHVIWTLADQCAATFVEAWGARDGNGVWPDERARVN